MLFIKEINDNSSQSKEKRFIDRLKQQAKKTDCDTKTGHGARFTGGHKTFLHSDVFACLLLN